ncbi:MAG: hypothetical protein IRZ21_11250 [Thermoleophilaceae bacterium]|nr:hypothetical protein [Thermoleophilaceae bacterium]
MIVCFLYPRLELLAAVGDRRALLSEPVALAPEAGRPQIVGEVTAAAEAFGVARGMRLGEALARCPGLKLVPPDPDGVRSLWSSALAALEDIGAGVESDRPGQGFFESRGLSGIHGGRLEGVLAAARRALAPALGRGVRIGAAPSRFCAYVAALRARPRRDSEVVVPESRAREFLARQPVSLLRSRPELLEMERILARLGIRTLGELAALPPAAVAERFGHPGLLALELAQGRDTPLEPRRPPEPVDERLELPEAASGPQLEHALELLVSRLLARPERRGRTLRSLSLSARFVEGGTWRTRVTLRRASADPARLRIVLSPRLAELPAPADWIALEVEAFGPPAREQARLLAERDPVEARRARIGEAVRQVRQAAGEDAALRVLELDPRSRLPERRAVLAPYPDEGGER